MKLIKDDHGFTYMEVVIAFMIFGLMFVFVSKLGGAIFDLNHRSQEEGRMYLIAELTYENYKTGINDLTSFESLTGFSLEDESFDDQGDLEARSLSIQALDDDFDVVIDETVVTSNISEVTITVESIGQSSGQVSVSGQVIKDSQ